MNKILFILTFATLLGSCSAESREINKAQQAVKELLVDPNSATFRYTRKALMGVCGEVNAKNSFGGYTGFKKFHYSPASKEGNLEVSVIIETEHNLSTINIVCENPN